MNAANMDIGAPQAGDNTRDWAAEMTGQLNVDYGWLDTGTSALLNEAREQPKVIETEEQCGIMSALVKKFRDHAAKIESLRVTEKEPHLRRGNAVDNFFSKLAAKCEGTKKNGRLVTDPGAADILHARVNAWNQKKLDEERRRREEEERKRREEEERLRREREEQERAAREAEAKAARARNEDNIRAAEQEATRRREEADRLAREEAAARQSRIDAEVAAKAKSADLVRTRHDTGAMTTMKQVPYVELVDRDLVDMNKLRPFFKDEHILMALKAWARTTGHKVKMDGAVIEMRDDTVIR